MDNHSIAKLSKEKGNIAFEAKDYATARSLFSHAMTFDQSNHLYPLNRCMANLKLERWNEAEADATKTLDLCPGNLKAFFRRGEARKELGKWDKARVDIQMYIDNKGHPTLGAHKLKAITDAESSPPSEPSSYVSSALESDLANLHLQDNSDSSCFSIHTSPTGKGAFASRDIQRGDLILSESAIFCLRIHVPEALKCTSIEAAVRGLSPSHLDSYLSLQNSHNMCECFPSPLLGTFTTNTFSTSDDKSGIFLEASRFNHSCSPNASFDFNSNTGELQIHAVDTISRGEEIFITYLTSRRLYGSTRQRRQDFLQDGYHFTCVCSICSLPEAESKKSDARRLRLNELWEIAGRPSPIQRDVIVEGIRLLQKEGHSWDVVDFLKEAGPMPPDWVFSSPEEAFSAASRITGTGVAELGEDSLRAAGIRKLHLS